MKRAIEWLIWSVLSALICWLVVCVCAWSVWPLSDWDSGTRAVWLLCSVLIGTLAFSCINDRGNYTVAVDTLIGLWPKRPAQRTLEEELAEFDRLSNLFDSADKIKSPSHD